MIPFQLPQLSMGLSDYMDTVNSQSKCGSCIEFIISLGKKFLSME